jgi:anti-sigma factor RsiW
LPVAARIVRPDRMSDPHEDDLLLNRYVDGELMAGERSALECRLEKDAGLRKRLAELTQLTTALDIGLGLIERPDEPATQVSGSRDWAGLAADIANGSRGPSLSLWVRRYPLRAAVAALLCALVGAGVVLAIRASWPF